MVKAFMAAAEPATRLDLAEFGAHSLCIGGATAALAAGVMDTAAIRCLGRWSSDVYEVCMRL